MHFGFTNLGSEMHGFRVTAIWKGKLWFGHPVFFQPMYYKKLYLQLETNNLMSLIANNHQA